MAMHKGNVAANEVEEGDIVVAVQGIDTTATLVKRIERDKDSFKYVGAEYHRPKAKRSITVAHFQRITILRWENKP